MHSSLDENTPSAPEDGAPDDERGLWAAFKDTGSVAARERLFTRHVRFARNVARRHHREQAGRDVELCDLYQSAYAGLLEAMDHFEPERGTPFRPFAAHRISGSIRDGLAHMNEMREQLSWRRRLRRERMQSLAEAPPETRTPLTPVEKLAELALGLALGFMLEGTGLVAPAAEDETEQPATVATAYDSLAWKETLQQLHEELAALPEREEIILRQHYLNGLGFDHIASLLAISKGRVSQLHRAALLTLRKRLQARQHRKNDVW